MEVTWKAKATCIMLYIAPYLCIFGGYDLKSCWRIHLLDGLDRWESLPDLPQETFGSSCAVI
jgi:hypothetical protein